MSVPSKKIDAKAIYEAAREKNLAFLKNLGDGINVRDKEGMTAVHLAVVHNSLAAIQALYDSGANFLLENNEHEMPIHLAAMEGKLEIVAALAQCDPVSFTAGINRAETRFGTTPLHHAALLGHDDVVQFLLENKANPHATTAPNPLRTTTALSYCLRGGDRRDDNKSEKRKKILQSLANAGVSLFNIPEPDTDETRLLHYEALTDMLENPFNYQHLNLTGFNVGAESQRKMLTQGLQALAKNPGCVESLCLDGVSLRKEDITALSLFIKNAPALRKVSLIGVVLDNEASTLITQAFQDNSTVAHLYLTDVERHRAISLSKLSTAAVQKFGSPVFGAAAQLTTDTLIATEATARIGFSKS